MKTAVQYYNTDKHNLIEGEGAAPLAALLKGKARNGRRFALMASGGDIDREAYAATLAV